MSPVAYVRRSIKGTRASQRLACSAVTSRKLAIIVGSEGRGVRDIVKKGADFVVDIPMRGKVGSLNVSVAAAVALFEIARRRAAAKL